MSKPTSDSEAVKNPRTWAGIYLLLMLVATCISGRRLLAGTGIWTLADWLINYRGGFVRRGLFGSMALLLQPLLYLRLPMIVLLFATVLYVCVFACLYLLVKRIRWNVWLVASFASPVTIACAFVSTSGFHKEVLFHAVFAVFLVRLLHLHQQGRHLGWKESAYLAVTGVLGVLNHELFAIYFPYIVAAIYVGEADWRRATRIALVPAIAVGMTFVAVATHPGTPAQARAVCESLGASNHAMCTGSINYLAHTRDEARAETASSVAEYHYLTFLPPLTVLGLLPIAMAFRRLHRQCVLPAMASRALVTGTMCAVLMSALLFLYGADWGRWIQIHCFSLFLLLLFASALYGTSLASDRPRATWSTYTQAAAVLVYATCWSLPGTTNIPTGGYVSMFGRIVGRALHR